MPVKIKSVIKKSLASRKGLKDGDILLSINRKPVNDFFDYNFYCKDSSLRIEFERQGRVIYTLIKKEEDEDIGLEFESFLMDKEQHCKNKCIFCFIDQLPDNMRKSLYFKDDDSRLSFLFGNYITLTNLTERDVERIIEMKISPVNVSVHTMNKELRVKMMKNKRAGECLDLLSEFAAAGIEINTQLVLCPGINDDAELEYSLTELGKLYPSVKSIAVVPVGVTKFREGLFDMPVYTKQTAAEVIETVDRFGDEFLEKHGTRLAFAADEFYLKAEMEIPDGTYYENYCQIENGVGMWTSLKEEFLSSLDNADFDGKRNISLATGTAAYPLMKSLADAVCFKFPEVKISVFEILNDFFGHTITVAGLITGTDLINQLKGRELGEELLIPSVMLRSEGDVFLDDISLSEAEKALNIKIKTVSCDGYDLLDRMLGIEY